MSATPDIRPAPPPIPRCEKCGTGFMVVEGAAFQLKSKLGERGMWECETGECPKSERGNMS